MADLLPDGLRELKGDRIRSIRAFVNDFFFGRGPDADIEPLPRLEDVLSLIDSAIVDNRPFSDEYSVAALTKIRENLVYLISGLLARRLTADDVWQRKGNRVVRDFGRSLDPEDTVISLNYDIIIDNALQERFGVPDYGTQLRFLYLNYPDAVEAREMGSGVPPPPLYKLHGSLNWLYCPSCQALDVTVGVKGALMAFSEVLERAPAQCPECEHLYEPLIITPTFLKTYANGLLTEVWRRAEHALTTADRIVFIGYSLPDADVQIKSLVKRAAFRNGRRRGKNRPEILVVDIQPPGGEFVERYRRLFGQDVRYRDFGFEGFVERI